MPRKPSPNQASDDELMTNEITRAYELYTLYELTVIAALWCGGDYEVVHRENRGMRPIALTVAALLTVKHPLLRRPNGDIIFSALGCAVECMMVQIEARPIAIPTIPPKPPEVVPTPCVQPGYNVELYPGTRPRGGAVRGAR